jgi:hypothetical protein
LLCSVTYIHRLKYHLLRNHNLTYLQNFSSNIYTRTSFHRIYTLLAHEGVFWILMGRPLLIRDRELASREIFLGWVGVFSCSLEADEYLSKNGIRVGPLLGSVCFGIFHWCSAYIRHLGLVVSLLLIFVRLVRRFGFY